MLYFHHIKLDAIVQRYDRYTGEITFEARILKIARTSFHPEEEPCKKTRKNDKTDGKRSKRNFSTFLKELFTKKEKI